jgi:hypothetical protein
MNLTTPSPTTPVSSSEVLGESTLHPKPSYELKTLDEVNSLTKLVTELAKLRPIGFSVNLARIAGDVKAGLLLSQLLYWTRVGVNVEANNGWIVKSRDQWSIETGLSRFEQETARTTLLKAGLIQEARVGNPARIAHRIVLQAVSHGLAKLLRSEPVQWSLFDVRNDAQQVRQLLGRNMAFYRQFSLLADSVTGAVFLSRAVAIQRSLVASQTENKSRASKQATRALELDWFVVSSTVWSIETGLTPAQVRFVKQKLCQLNLIEQAVQEYPKKKLFVRLKVSRVLEALLKGLNKREEDHEHRTDRPSGALSATWTERPSDPSDSTWTNRPSVSQRYRWTERPSVSDELTRTNQPAITQGEALTNCPSVPQGDAWTNRPSVSQRHRWTECPSIPEPPSSSNFAKLEKLSTSENSQQNQQVISPQTLKTSVPEDGFITTPGEFSHGHRRVLSSLHAGAGFLITNQTTPPTTEEITTQTTQKVSGDFYHSPESVGGVGGISQVDSESHDVPHFSNRNNAFDLIYPNGLSDDDINSFAYIIIDHQTRHQLSFERAQLIVDELAAMMSANKVKSPGAYLATLLRKDAAGQLQLVHALQWRKQQAQAEAKQLAEANARIERERMRQTLNTGSAIEHSQAARDPLAEAQMAPELAALWAACLAQLTMSFPAQSVNVWLKPLSLRRDADKLFVCAQSRFKLDHIKSTFGTKIEAAVRELSPQAIGMSLSCVFVTVFPAQASALPASSTLATLTRNTGHGH